MVKIDHQTELEMIGGRLDDCCGCGVDSSLAERLNKSADSPLLSVPDLDSSDLDDASSEA